MRGVVNCIFTLYVSRDVAHLLKFVGSCPGGNVLNLKQPNIAKKYGVFQEFQEFIVSQNSSGLNRGIEHIQ